MGLLHVDKILHLPEDMDTTIQCEGSDSFTCVYETIQKVVDKQNEGYSMAACLPYISHIVQDLHQLSTARIQRTNYLLQVCSSILKCRADHRKDKKDDSVVFKVNNGRYVIIIELKFNVGFSFSDKSQYVAQLLLETLYAVESEKHKHRYIMLSILADSINWHIFIMDTHLPMTVIKYFNLLWLNFVEQFNLF